MTCEIGCIEYARSCVVAVGRVEEVSLSNWRAGKKSVDRYMVWDCYIKKFKYSCYRF